MKIRHDFSALVEQSWAQTLREFFDFPDARQSLRGRLPLAL
jgi:hypothetical protein